MQRAESRGHFIPFALCPLPSALISEVFLDVCRERELPHLLGVERLDDVIHQNRRADEHLVADRVCDRIQHRIAGGCNRGLADAARADRRFRIGYPDGVPGNVDRHIENRRRAVVVEPLRERHAVLLVIDPPVTDRVSDAEYRTAQYLAAERGRVNDGADVAHGEKLRDRVLPGFDVDFDLSKRGGEGPRRSVALVIVLRNAHESLPGQRRGGARRHRIDVLGQLVAIVNASELDGALGRLRQRHPAAAALAVDALAAHFVVLGFPAEIFRGDLLQLLDSVTGRRVRRARMRVYRLAAARVAAPRQMLRRIAPDDLHFLPRYADHLRRHALAVGERFGAEIADASMDAHPAVWRDDEEAVETYRAAAIGADADADAAHLRAAALRATRNAFVPVEPRRTLVQRFLEETARDVAALASSIGRPVFRLSFRRVQLADRYLIDAQLARRFVDDLIHNLAALKAARLGERAARRRVRDRGDATVTERFGLIHQRRVPACRIAVAAGTVRPAFGHGKHVHRGHAAFLRETHLHAAVHRRAGAADHMFLFTADTHHHRRAAEFLGQQRGNDVGDRSAALRAIAAARVCVHQHDVFRLQLEPAHERKDRLRHTLRRGVDMQLAVLPKGHRRPRLEALMTDVRAHECVVEDQVRLLESLFDVAELPFGIGERGHRQPALPVFLYLSLVPLHVDGLGNARRLPLGGRCGAFPDVAFNPRILRARHQ